MKSSMLHFLMVIQIIILIKLPITQEYNNLAIAVAILSVYALLVTGSDEDEE